MLILRFWVPVVAGVVFLAGALFLWARGRGSRSLPYRWFFLAYVACALFTEFALVANLAPPHTFHLWSDLELAALFLAVCADLVAMVNVVREAQRTAGMQRYHS